MSDSKSETVEPAALGEWNGVRLFWRKDGYGRPERALYAGGLYLGEVMCLPTNPRLSGAIWRSWLMTTDEGDEIGWYMTEQEAKDALVDAALKALLQPTTGT